MTIAKIAGVVLVVVGLAAAVYFVVTALNDPEYARAALLLDRNKGNVLYEAEFGKAQLKRAFLFLFAGAGGLLSINGVTLFLVGMIGSRRSS